MKTILYLNKRYCTRFLDLKSIVKSAVSSNDKSTMIELLISFRDRILENWLIDIAQIDPTISTIAEQIKHIRVESTDTEIIQKLSTMICSSSFELELNPLEYVEVLEQVEVNSGYTKQIHKLGDIISLPDIVKSFTITFFIKIKTSRNDRISILTNEINHSVSLQDKNKVHSLSCTINRNSDSSFPSVSVHTNNCMLGTIYVMNFVDLGLDVKWACCNLGSKSIYGEGNYYAWGELSPKENFTDNTYRGNKSIQNIAGHKDYDAATVTLGENWRIPNKRQWQQLISNCLWTYVCDKEKNGFWIKSKANSNSMFLPLTGYKQDGKHSEKNYCFCWTAIEDDSIDSFALCCANCQNGEQPNPTIVYKNKIAGLAIRPVYVK